MKDWNLYGLSPLRQALHSNRWKQPELKQAASEFLWGKYLSNDPLKMYVAFRIWNSYLLAREPRDQIIRINQSLLSGYEKSSQS